MLKTFQFIFTRRMVVPVTADLAYRPLISTIVCFIQLTRDTAPEVSTRDIIINILETGRNCYVPRCTTDTKMEMVKLRSYEDYVTLPKNKMSIAEPELNEDREKG
jgi:5-formyltetrahydrofolate cyclo-ligase